MVRPTSFPTIESSQIKAGVDVVADVRVVGVQSAVGAVTEPIWIVVVAGFVLAENDFP